MPPKEQPSRRGTGSTRPERPLRRPASSRLPITFVNSQDPNSRSTIQRHTARHSNAQRRVARLQSLRSSSSRPRLLEWQRRRSSVEADGVSTTSAQSSASSLTISPAPGFGRSASAPGDISSEIASAITAGSDLQMPRILDRSISAPTQDSVEETLYVLTNQDIERCKFSWTVLYVSLLTTPLDLQITCVHGQPDQYRSVIDYILTTDPSSAAILASYILALLALDPSQTHSTEDQIRSQHAYTYGTRLLRARLTNPATVASNINLQCVLLLVAYASDMRTPAETSIHVSALTRMVQQRGGMAQLLEEVEPMLALQLTEIAQSRVRHLTVPCGIDCEYDLRFPDGMEVLREDN